MYSSRSVAFSSSAMTKLLAWAFTVFIVLYIAVPIAVTFAMSFSSASIIRFPITGWSLKWYLTFFDSDQWGAAFFNSLVIACGTAALSTPIGVLAAWAFERYSFPFKNVCYIAIMLPLFMPGVVLGLGIAIAFGGLSIGGVPIYGTRMLVVLAHSLWAMPLVFMLMEATFRTVDRRIIEASGDLGARPLRTFCEIVLPSVSTGILTSALFSFVISLNEFVMALFLTNRGTNTLPVLMWLSLRSAGTPRLAVAAIILALAVICGLMISFLWYARQRRPSTP